MTNNDVLKVIDVITEPFFEIDGVQKGHLINGFVIEGKELTVFVPTLDFFNQKQTINRLVPKLNELGFDVISYLNNKIVICLNIS